MADIIHFDPAAHANPCPVTDADVWREPLFAILDARDLDHARQLAFEAMAELDEDEPPAPSA